ncbi:MAG: tetraacyldisaccharide 4'-kinase [Crocinitomicaceae bacterium]|nr:tetraacyldisaccharide 4'-kinase [Crocinitomicaceae bacterium]
MQKLRILLLPFSWIYGIVVAIRNWLFNIGFFKSMEIPGKSICVGNLSTGGTGKTPHVDLLVDHFVKSGVKTSTLSRGYGRSTKGTREVFVTDSAESVGDEPLLYKLKYKENITVIVAEKRIDGVNLIHKSNPSNELIILDDAFQHRGVKAGLNIIITDYNNPYYKDFILPAGNLRESKKGIKRADIVIVSKCPKLSTEEMNRIKTKLNFPEQKIFFSSIKYAELIPFYDRHDVGINNILLVTGIGNPTPLINHLKKEYSVTHLNYKDHHLFSTNDIKDIREKFDTFASKDKIVVTTEKDFMRLKDFEAFKDNSWSWYYQPIITEINERQKFNLLIDNYVSEI